VIVVWEIFSVVILVFDKSCYIIRSIVLVYWNLIILLFVSYMTIVLVFILYSSSFTRKLLNVRLAAVCTLHNRLSIVAK